MQTLEPTLQHPKNPKKFLLDKNGKKILDKKIAAGKGIAQFIDSTAKKVASRLAFQIRRLLLKDTTPDTGCAIKVFRKKDFLQLPFFNHIHRFLPFLFNTFGGKIISIPVNHRSRSSGISKYSNFQRFLVGINDLYGVIWLRKRSVWPILKKRDKHLKSKEKK